MNPNEDSASKQIDTIISNLDDWRGEMLATLRAVLQQADPRLVEEIKWRKPSRPQGVPVWTYNGNVCIADTLKNAVRLTFPKGAQVSDPGRLFNARLDSKTMRAIDFYEGAPVNEAALTAIITETTALNDAT